LTVSARYDLFETLPVSSFPGLGNLMGVPLGTFDFGSGPVGVGTTDTIVQRLSDVTVAAPGDTGSTGLLVKALQMETVTPVDFGGAGLDNYFVTLSQSQPSTGTIDITFASPAGGTFSSSLEITFDIRKGSLNGPIIISPTLTLTNSGALWDRIPPPGAVVIDGINHFLNGQNIDNDFWPGVAEGGVPGIVVEAHPGGGQHVVRTALVGGGGVPEPSTWVMLAMAGGVVPAYVRSARRRSGSSN